MIRVIIDRQFTEGLEDLFYKEVLELRRMVSEQPGYISGETLCDMNNPRRSVVISTWRARHDWEQWHNSHQRRQLSHAIKAMLSEEQISVLEHL